VNLPSRPLDAAGGRGRPARRAATVLPGHGRPRPAGAGGERRLGMPWSTVRPARGVPCLAGQAQAPGVRTRHWLATAGRG